MGSIANNNRVAIHSDWQLVDQMEQQTEGQEMSEPKPKKKEFKRLREVEQELEGNLDAPTVLQDAEDTPNTTEFRREIYKSFGSKVNFLPNVRCPFCGYEMVISTSTGLSCVSCNRTLTLSVPATLENDEEIVGMVISDDGTVINWRGENYYTAGEEVGGGDEKQTTLEYIMDDLLPEWQIIFAAKHSDYGDAAKDLGPSGQFVNMSRNMIKLKNALWKDQKLAGEQPREILMDLIGHCFLTIEMFDRGHDGV